MSDTFESLENTSHDIKNAVERITQTIEAYENHDFEDFDLWETFREDFEDFTEEDFKSAGTHWLRQLRSFLRKRGVWILKNERVTIARSLSNTLLEGRPGVWTEAEIVEWLDREQFISFQIKRLIENDFGPKQRKFGVYTPSSRDVKLHRSMIIMALRGKRLVLLSDGS